MSPAGYRLVPPMAAVGPTAMGTIGCEWTVLSLGQPHDGANKGALRTPGGYCVKGAVPWSVAPRSTRAT